MKIFSVDLQKIQTLYVEQSVIENKEFSMIIHHCVESLDAGNIIIFPTDTIYGLLGIYNKNVIDRIHRLKDRDLLKPCLLLVHDEFNLENWIDWTRYNAKHLKKTKEISNSCWGSKTTFVFYKNADIDYPKGETIAFRKVLDTQNIILARLLKVLNRPILAPSLNRFGEQPICDLETMKLEFGDEVSICIYDTSFKSNGKNRASSILDTTSYPYVKLR